MTEQSKAERAPHADAKLMTAAAAGDHDWASLSPHVSPTLPPLRPHTCWVQPCAPHTACCIRRRDLLPSRMPARMSHPLQLLQQVHMLLAADADSAFQEPEHGRSALMAAAEAGHSQVPVLHLLCPLILILRYRLKRSRTKNKI